MEQNLLQMDVLPSPESRIEDDCGRASSVRCTEGRGSFSGDTLERCHVSVDPGRPSIYHNPLASTAAGVTKSVAAASLDPKDTVIHSSVTERPHISLWQV